MTPGQRCEAALGRLARGAGAGPRRRHRRQPRPHPRRARRPRRARTRCWTCPGSSCSAATTTSARRSRTPPGTCSRTSTKHVHGRAAAVAGPARGADRARLARRHAHPPHARRRPVLTIAVAGVDDPHIRHDRYDLRRRPARTPTPTCKPRPDPLPRAPRARRLRRRRLRPGPRRPHPRRPAPPSRLRRDRHQLRPRPLPRPRRLPLGQPHAPARLRRPGHLPVRARPVLLPARGQPADPRRPPGRPGVGGGPPPRRRPRTSARLVAARRTSRASGCGAAW